MPDPCPSVERWRCHLDGSLSPDEQLALTAHLDGCAECRRSLELLAAGSDSLLHVARTVGQETTDPEKEERSGLDASSALDEMLTFLGPPLKRGDLGSLAHYRILSVVGKGGFGVVLKAFDTKLQRVVAIKAMSPSMAGDSTARKRFVREARTAAAIKSDFVVAIHGVEGEGEHPYLVMEMIDGRSLQDKLAGEGPLETREILRIASQAAAGLAAAHAQGLVHRDIKPANILLENSVERVKITDFGLARAIDDVNLTRSGFIAGTPLYMSPEQAEGRPIDHRSDLFSLGTVMYAMCTGWSPFRASSTMAVLKRVTEVTPPPIRNINPDIPEWLCAVITRLHAKKPEERYSSAREVAELLEKRLAELQSGGSIIPEHRPHRTRFGHGAKIAVAVTAVVLLGVVAGFVGMLVTNRSSTTEVSQAFVSRSSSETARLPTESGKDKGDKEPPKSNDKDPTKDEPKKDEPKIVPRQVAERDVEDFAAIHDASRTEFDDWIARMKKDKMRPTNLTVQTIMDNPRYSAVAVLEPKVHEWELTRVSGADVVIGRHIDSMQNKNFDAIAVGLAGDQGKIEHCFLWVKGLHRNVGVWGGHEGYAEGKVNEARNRKQRLHHRATFFGHGRTLYDVIINEDDGVAWTESLAMTATQCRDWVEKQRADGWRPDHLYAYGFEKRPQFGAILIKDKNNSDWDCSWSLTKAAYEEQLTKRRALGFRPLALVGYETEASEQRFSAIWIRYRVVEAKKE